MQLYISRQSTCLFRSLVEIVHGIDHGTFGFEVGDERLERKLLLWTMPRLLLRRQRQGKKGLSYCRTSDR